MKVILCDVCGEKCSINQNIIFNFSRFDYSLKLDVCDSCINKIDEFRCQLAQTFNKK